MSHTMPADATPNTFDDGCTPGQRSYLQYIDTLPYTPALVDWPNLSEEEKGYWEAMGVDQLSQVDVENAIRADLARRQRRDEEALWGTVGEMVGGMVEGIKKTNAVLMEEKVKAAAVRKQQPQQQHKRGINQQIPSAHPSAALINTPSALLPAPVSRLVTATVSAPVFVSTPTPSEESTPTPVSIPVSVSVPFSALAPIPAQSFVSIPNQDQRASLYSNWIHNAATQQPYISPYACLPSVARVSGPPRPPVLAPARGNGFGPVSSVITAAASDFAVRPGLLPRFGSGPGSGHVFDTFPDSGLTHIPSLDSIQNYQNPCSTPSQNLPPTALQFQASTAATNPAQKSETKSNAKPPLFNFTVNSLNNISTKTKPKIKPTRNTNRTATVNTTQTAPGPVSRTGLSSEIAEVRIDNRVQKSRRGRFRIPSPTCLDESSNHEVLSMKQLLAGTSTFPTGISSRSKGDPKTKLKSTAKSEMQQQERHKAQSRPSTQLTAQPPSGHPPPHNLIPKTTRSITSHALRVLKIQEPCRGGEVIVIDDDDDDMRRGHLGREGAMGMGSGGSVVGGAREDGSISGMGEVSGIGGRVGSVNLENGYDVMMGGMGRIVKRKASP
ncbi:hypothetical protein BKA61DRAFT_570197 [Leptodontidium sp. MPI-SDFR-AT-0119]|nr:hypothetical protein BKA61DRAFT_570197 [Leptodontidium sp. MPI-SDFR-AT-0119]